VVEDEVLIRMMLVEILNAHGHRTVEAGTLHDARQCLAAHVFDAVITDLGLPDGTGADLVQDILDGFPEVAVIVATGNTHPDDLDLDLAQLEALTAGRIDSYTMEKRYVTAAGSLVWVTVGGDPVRSGPALAVQRLEGRILLVDDDPLVRTLTAAQLADLGAEVVQVDGVDPAITVLMSDGAFDAVMTDIVMPGRDGYAQDAGNRLRAKTARRDQDTGTVVASVAPALTGERAPGRCPNVAAKDAQTSRQASESRIRASEP
jgi:CheY-like chemotaxis protein